MADIYVNNAPFINKWFYVTGAFGEQRGTRVHKGLDLAPAGYAGSLYAIDDFTVIYYGYDGSGYGNYFIAKNSSDMMYLYAHMASLPPQTGATFSRGDYIGEAGQTGSATGVHVHLEMQQGTTWNFNAPIEAYTNPCSYLSGINNVATYNDRYYYRGDIPPAPDTSRKKFPWYIYQNNSM